MADVYCLAVLEAGASQVLVRGNLPLALRLLVALAVLAIPGV